MASATLEEMQGDQIVMSVARALALANEAAVLHGTDPAKSLISILEEATPSGPKAGKPTSARESFGFQRPAPPTR